MICPDHSLPFVFFYFIWYKLLRSATIMYLKSFNMQYFNRTKYPKIVKIAVSYYIMYICITYIYVYVCMYVCMYVCIGAGFIPY